MEIGILANRMMNDGMRRVVGLVKRGVVVGFGFRLVRGVGDRWKGGGLERGLGLVCCDEILDIWRGLVLEGSFRGILEDRVGGVPLGRVGVDEMKEICRSFWPLSKTSEPTSVLFLIRNSTETY